MMLPRQKLSGAPVSLGLLGRNGNGVLIAGADIPNLLSQNPVLAVSLEPVGGSPTGAPTGPVLSAGALETI